jgi:5'-nucleotidase
MTGAVLKAVLEQQVFSSKMLQISSSLTYDWSTGAASDAHVTNLKINGLTVTDAGTYRVTVNNFLAAGGDSFTAFTQGTDPLIGMSDLDALVAYFVANSPSPVAPGPQNRINVVP